MKRLNKEYRRNGNSVNSFGSACACYLYTTCNCGFTGYDPVTEYNNYQDMVIQHDGLRYKTNTTIK